MAVPITVRHGPGNTVQRQNVYSSIRSLLQDVASILNFGPLDQLAVTQNGSEVGLDESVLDGADVNVSTRAGRKGN